jgi:hypothetical protein
MESVASLAWNWWQLSYGIGGNFRAEYAVRQGSLAPVEQGVGEVIKGTLAAVAPVAQFLGVCRWFKLVYKWRLAPLGNAPFCPKLAR